MDLISSHILKDQKDGSWGPLDGVDNRQYTVTYKVVGDKVVQPIFADAIDLVVVEARSAEGAVMDSLNSGSPDIVSLALEPEAPYLDSVSLGDPASSPTNADSLTFQIEFSEEIDQVDTADFGLYAEGAAETADALMLASEVVNDGDIGFDVKFSGDGIANYNGTVELRTIVHETSPIVGMSSRQPIEPHTDSVSFEHYTLDNTAPFVQSVKRWDPVNEKTAANTLTFLVTFDAPVTGLDDGDFALFDTGSRTLIADLSYALTDLDGNRLRGSGPWDQVLVEVRDQAPSTTLADYAGRVELRTTTNGVDEILDEVGNPMAAFEAPNGEPGSEYEKYELDQTAPPTLSAFKRFVPAESPTNANTLTFHVIFTAAVDEDTVDRTDFAVQLDPAASDIAISDEPVMVTDAGELGGHVEGSVYAVTVSGDGLDEYNGTVGLNLASDYEIKAGGVDLDLANPNTSETYTLENGAPEVGTIGWQYRAVDGQTVIGNPSASDVGVPGGYTVTILEFTERMDTRLVPQFTLNDYGDQLVTEGKISLDTNVSGWKDTDGKPSDTQFVLAYKFSESLEELPEGGSGTTFATVVSITNAADLGGEQLEYDPNSESIILYLKASKDDIAPTISKVERLAPSENPTAADELAFKVTFSEDILVDNSDDNLGLGDDFALHQATEAGAPSGTLITDVIVNVDDANDESDTTFHVKVSGPGIVDYDGEVGLWFADGANLTDRVRNAADIEFNSGVTDPYQTFTLENKPKITATTRIEVVSGTPQEVQFGETFEAPLTVKVWDPDTSTPIVGAKVTFTAPSSGASLIFADTGGVTETVTTGTDGIAVSSTVTANMTPSRYVGTPTLEPYHVVATAVGPADEKITGSARFEMTNLRNDDADIAQTMKVIRTFVTSRGQCHCRQSTRPDGPADRRPPRQWRPVRLDH